MVDISPYMTYANLAFACAGVLLLVPLLWYLRRHFGKPPYPVPLELLDVGTFPSPVRDMVEEFNSQLTTYNEKDTQVRMRLQKLEENDLENTLPVVILDDASENEHSNIRSILPELPLGDISNQAIVDSIRKAGSNSIATGFRGLRGWLQSLLNTTGNHRVEQDEKYVSYTEIVRDVARKVGVKITKKMPMIELETESINTVFKTILKNCTPEDRVTLEKGIASQYEKNYTGPTVAITTLGLAKLSGFALYLASTANTIAIATSLGIAVPSYAGVISILSFVTGPVGWAALAGISAIIISGPDYKKTIPGVMLIASIRARQIFERDKEIQEKKDALSKLATERSSLESLLEQIHKDTAKLSSRKHVKGDSQLKINSN